MSGKPIHTNDTFAINREMLSDIYKYVITSDKQMCSLNCITLAAIFCSMLQTRIFYYKPAKILHRSRFFRARLELYED